MYPRNHPATVWTICGAVAGSVLTLVVTSLWVTHSRPRQQQQEKEPSSTTNTTTIPTPFQIQDDTMPMTTDHHHHHQHLRTVERRNVQLLLPMELREEQLSRHHLYFGIRGMERIQQASVVVIGLGGVGSHVAHMLARSGIRHLRLIDFDQVTLSSLNRHACATLADVGIPKAICLQRFLQQIVGGDDYCHIEAFVQMYTSETASELLDHDDRQEEEDHRNPNHPKNRHWDFVVDAIDDVPTKAALLRHCLERKWRVISCMGAGGKSDVTRLHISDLRSASRDPLATKLRQTLKLQQQQHQQQQQPYTENYNNHNSDDDSKDQSISYLDDMQQLAVVYSSEKPVVKLADFTEEQQEHHEEIHEYGAVDGMRIRILPVLGTMPAIMGQAMAGWCLCELGQKSFLPVSTERVSRSVRNRTYQRLRRREEQITKQILQEQQQKPKQKAQPQAKTKQDNESTITRDSVIDKNDDDGATTTTISNNPLDDDTLRHHDDRSMDEWSSGRIINNKWVGPLQIDSDDVEFLLELWRNRCAVTGQRLGTVLELARWDLIKPSSCDNLVLLGVGAMQQLDKYDKSHFSSAVIQSIEERLKSCQHFHRPNETTQYCT